MGRNSHNKRKRLDGAGSHTKGQQQQQQHQHHRPHKKKMVGRFWVEDCKETKLSSHAREADTKNATGTEGASDGAVLSFDVLITRSDLVDDYRQIPRTSEIESDRPIHESKKHDVEKSLKDPPIRTTSGESGDDEKVETEEHPLSTQGVLSDTFEEQGKDNDKKTVDTNQDSTQTITPNTEAAAVTKAFAGKVEIASEKGNVATSTANIDNAFICVRRSRSAKKPMQVTADSVENFRPLPNGDCGDGIINPYPKEEVPDKFWSQRRRLFTRFDDGIQLDKESWFSVTPEAIAKHIAAHLVTNRENVTIIDPFSGCGGNAIAFAQRPEVKLVVCVDKDIEKLKMAACNAAIYNVPAEKMVFIHGNGCTILSSYDEGNLVAVRRQESDESNDARSWKATEDRIGGLLYPIGGIDLLPNTLDCVFLSPPWGGVDYGNVGKRHYTLQCINVQGEGDDVNPMDGGEILLRAAKAVGTQSPLAYFLPRNINGISLAKSALLAGYKGPLVLEQNVLNGKLKTVTAYFGL